MAGKIESIKKACKMTDIIFKDLLKNISNFKTESDMDKFIRNAARKRKLKIAFPPVVATGKNAADPHHKPKNSRLKGFTVIDFGVKINNYCSDMTRTLFFGKPNKTQKNLYNLLLKVQNTAIKDLKPNKTYFSIDKKARENLGKHKKYFIHALGHGISKKVHCKPIIASIFKKKKSTKKREKLIQQVKNTKININDTITIEPGIYIKNKSGIRIEDTLIIKRSNAEILTNSKKKLYILKSP